MVQSPPETNAPRSVSRLLDRRESSAGGQTGGHGTKYCPSCASPIAADARACSVCGWSPGKKLVQFFAFVLVFALAIAGAGFAFTNFHRWFPDKAGAQIHVSKGDDCIYREDYGEAVKEFNQAAALSPQDPGIRAKYANALDKDERPNEALAQIEIAVALAPADYDINDKYTTLLEDLNQLEKAVAPFNVLLAAKPKDAKLRRQASWLYEKLGDKRKATELLKEAVQLDPEWGEGWVNLADLLDEQGKTDEAMGVLKKGISKDPRSGSLYYELGLFLSRSKDPNAAVAPLKRAAELDSDFEDDVAEILERITKAAGKPIYLVKLQKSGLSFSVDVVLNEKVRTKLVLDSGATSVSISTQAAKKLGLDLNSAPTTSLTSATGHDTARVVSLSSVRIGTAKIANVRAVVYDGPSSDGEEGLLGMSFLQHFKFTVDAKHSQLWLTGR